MEKALIKNENVKAVLSSMFLSVKLAKEKNYKLTKQSIYDFGKSYWVFWWCRNMVWNDKMNLPNKNVERYN